MRPVHADGSATFAVGVRREVDVIQSHFANQHFSILVSQISADGRAPNL